MSAKDQLAPESLVARIIAELQANPDAQRLLLRALLTNEFLGVPARLDRIERDIAELKADVAVLKTDVAVLKTDVAHLKGSDLEHRLHRRIRPLISAALAVKRPRIVQSLVQDPDRDFVERLEEAVESGRITREQDIRIEATDLILHARRRDDRVPVWIAVEASNKVHANDIQRARATADALCAALDTEAIPVVAGYAIDPPDVKRAKAAGVRHLPISPPASI